MPFPFVKMPTLGEFIRAAVSQGCKENTAASVRGTKGTVPSRYLVAPGPRAAVVILPNIADDDRLAPAVLSQYVRTLKLRGFEDYVLDD